MEAVGNRAGSQFYALTGSGRKQLAVEKDRWARLTGTVQLIFNEGKES